MKKRLSALLLAAMILSLAACAAPEHSDDSSLTANQRYALEKLDQVNDMVLTRETVPSDCLRYLPDDLAELVEEYNDQTGNLRIRFTANARRVVHSLLYDLEDRTEPLVYEYPQVYYDWVGRISHYALFENFTELCENDPRAAAPTGCGLCPATSMMTGMCRSSRIISAWWNSCWTPSTPPGRPKYN